MMRCSKQPLRRGALKKLYFGVNGGLNAIAPCWVALKNEQPSGYELGKEVFQLTQ